jgi:phosphoribosylglycinamide formyltransferase-1
MQAEVPVLAGDDEKRLAARVLQAEHKIYPAALKLLAEDKLIIVGERVIVAT